MCGLCSFLNLFNSVSQTDDDITNIEDSITNNQVVENTTKSVEMVQIYDFSRLIYNLIEYKRYHIPLTYYYYYRIKDDVIFFYHDEGKYPLKGWFHRCAVCKATITGGLKQYQKNVKICICPYCLKTKKSFNHLLDRFYISVYPI